jgi:hypothetical protein
MTKQILGDGNSDGTVLGQSTTELLGFFGATTPIAQPSAAAQDALTASSSDAAAIGQVIVLLTEVRTQLVALGLIKGSS